METITIPEITFSGATLLGKPVQKLTRTIGDLKGLFADQNAFEQEDANQIAYEVESLFLTLRVPLKKILPSKS